MERTILVGDHLLVNKFAFAPRLPALAKFLPYRDVKPGRHRRLQEAAATT